MSNQNVIRYVTGQLERELDQARYGQISAVIKVQKGAVTFVEVSSASKLTPQEIEREPQH